jgi:hypothetical protein
VSGWVPIPNEAIAIAGKTNRSGLVDLYDVASRTGWAPRRFTERGLAEEWGVDRRKVREFLDGLTAAGLVTVAWADPKSRQGSVLTVVPPLNQTRNQSVRQSPRQLRNQSDEPAGLFDDIIVPVVAPVVAPVVEPVVEPPRAFLLRAREEEEQDEEEEKQKPPAVRVSAEAERFWTEDVQLAIQQQRHDEDYRIPGVGKTGALRDALTRACKADASVVLDAMRFLAWSPDARWYRSKECGAFGLKMLLRPAHLQDYAAKWRANPKRTAERYMSAMPAPLTDEERAEFDAWEMPR